MFRSSLLATALLMVPTAYAQETPMAIQNGPDLEFSCGSLAGETRQCHPTHHYYKRYMHLANWRFVGEASAPGSCVLGHTYGYGRKAVWVAGDCVGVFRAPDLRYGDAYNAQRLSNEPRAMTHVVVPYGSWRNW